MIERKVGRSLVEYSGVSRSSPECKFMGRDACYAKPTPELRIAVYTGSMLKRSYLNWHKPQRVPLALIRHMVPLQAPARDVTKLLAVAPRLPGWRQRQ